MRIGIDLGGSKIAAGIVSDGRVMERIQVETGAHKGAEHVIGQLRKVIEELGSPESIGIGVPGVFEGTTIVRTPNIPGLAGVDLREALELKELCIDNDLRCALRAEHTYGAGKGTEHFVICMIGTGLGLAAVVDGKVVRGAHGYTSETGGSMANPLEIIEGGKPRKWDHVLAGPCIVERHRSNGGTEENATAIWASDSAAARKTRREVEQLLGLYILRATLHYDPERIALGGGAFQSGMLAGARAFAEKHASYPIPELVVMQVEDAGILGAALL